MSIQWTVHATYDDGSGGYVTNVDAHNEAEAAIEAQLEAFCQRHAFFQLSYMDKRAIGEHVRLGEWDEPIFDGLRDLRISIASVERVEPASTLPVTYTLPAAAPPRIVGYEVVVGTAPYDLVRAVQCKLEQGWQPLGVPMLLPPILFQVMIKYAA